MEGNTFFSIMGTVVEWMAQCSIYMFEIVGIVVLVVAGLHGIWDFIRHDPCTKLNLAKGMALCLEFKLGSEILRTLIVRDVSELAVVAGIIVLRAALTLLIHWEIKTENMELPESEEESKKEKKPLFGKRK